MSGEVIRLREISAGGIRRDLVVRIEGVLALIRAIDAGELLAALPECELAQRNQKTAISILAVAERELTWISEEFSGG